VRAAEAQLQVMREATQKMVRCCQQRISENRANSADRFSFGLILQVTAVERLQGHLSFLQDCWNQLHTVISGPESTTQQHASFDSVAAQTLQPEEAKNSPAQEAANKLAPTDVVIVTATASLTLQQASQFSQQTSVQCQRRQSCIQLDFESA
jgi:hypothetical protein